MSRKFIIWTIIFVSTEFAALIGGIIATSEVVGFDFECCIAVRYCQLDKPYTIKRGECQGPLNCTHFLKSYEQGCDNEKGRATFILLISAFSGVLVFLLSFIACHWLRNRCHRVTYETL
jgi:hypothetical protein